ncbi:uncharacterized protein LOC100908583 isoform X2 [Galendromus occidentalis]|uniref:Uncharacterized protein LOC100908349 isoform X2 n=1 Tax=Galendromus occidentalis TaxID=34638 RepID=A0AAJ6VW61_9ACAR|nr:uncharacterized protein LOC100908349 isoform X2 [Galendromus occidentalis]XP_003739997.1 uncharacterized protein LOC100908583 isoform X2 [Galendromus occidentalis]
MSNSGLAWHMISFHPGATWTSLRGPRNPSMIVRNFVLQKKTLLRENTAGLLVTAFWKDLGNCIPSRKRPFLHYQVVLRGARTDEDRIQTEAILTDLGENQIFPACPSEELAFALTLLPENNPALNLINDRLRLPS